MSVEVLTIPLQEYVFMDTHARVFYTTTQEVSQATLIVGPTVVERATDKYSPGWLRTYQH
jgi:hypothetical protein